MVAGNSLNEETSDETVFIKMYHSSAKDDSCDQDETENANHAEKELCNDMDNIIDTINKFHLTDDKTIKLTLFQSNSPCELCSQDLLEFQQKFQASLESSNNSFPMQYEMQVQHIYQIERSETINQLIVLNESGLVVQPLNWEKFFDSFSELVWQRYNSKDQSAIMIPRGKPERARLRNEQEIVNYLYIQALPWVVKFKLQQTKEVGRDINMCIKKNTDTEEQRIQSIFEVILQWVENENIADDEKIKTLIEKEPQRLGNRLKNIIITGVPEDTGQSDKTLVAKILRCTGVAENPRVLNAWRRERKVNPETYW